MGFHKIWVDRDYNAGALGGFTYGVTTEEMAAAYSTLENDGVYRKATCIRVITDSSGKKIVDESSREQKVYEKNAARYMTQMLREVVLSGTGTAANIENGIVVGKTGTTNSTKDAWFCGYSKYYTTTVWAGYDYPREMSGGISYDVNSVFRDFMTEMHTDLPVVEILGTSASTEQETTAAATQQESSAQTTVEATIEEETTAVERVTSENVTDTTTQTGRPSQTQRTNSSQQQTTRAMQYGDIDATTRTDADSTIRGGDW
jgi:membrane peptidoglycan carboxypeptidase